MEIMVYGCIYLSAPSINSSISQDTHQSIEGVMLEEALAARETVPLAVTAPWHTQAQQEQGPKQGLHGCQRESVGGEELD